MSPYKIPQHHKKLMPGHTLEECYDLLAEAVNEMSGDCDERCVDGYHDDNCQALDSHFTIIQQQKRIVELEAERDNWEKRHAEISTHCDWKVKRIAELEADNERLRDAIRVAQNFASVKDAPSAEVLLAQIEQVLWDVLPAALREDEDG